MSLAAPPCPVIPPFLRQLGAWGSFRRPRPVAAPKCGMAASTVTPTSRKICSVMYSNRTPFFCVQKGIYLRGRWFPPQGIGGLFFWNHPPRRKIDRPRGDILHFCRRYCDLRSSRRNGDGGIGKNLRTWPSKPRLKGLLHNSKKSSKTVGETHKPQGEALEKIAIPGGNWRPPGQLTFIDHPGLTFIKDFVLPGRKGNAWGGTMSGGKSPPSTVHSVGNIVTARTAASVMLTQACAVSRVFGPRLIAKKLSVGWHGWSLLIGISSLKICYFQIWLHNFLQSNERVRSCDSINASKTESTQHSLPSVFMISFCFVIVEDIGYNTTGRWLRRRRRQTPSSFELKYSLHLLQIHGRIANARGAFECFPPRFAKCMLPHHPFKTFLVPQYLGNVKMTAFVSSS